MKRESHRSSTSVPVLERRFRAYLFDLDGTLVDSAPDISAALNHSLTGHDYPPVAESLTRHWVGHGSLVLVQQALAHHDVPERANDDVHVQSLLAQFIDYYSHNIADRGGLYPGVLETLMALKVRAAGVAVVTNKYEGLSRSVLDALALSDFVDVLVGGDTLPQRKPAPEPVWHACRQLQVAAADALFVGDSITDVQTARAAGCAVVCVRDGYNHGTPPEELGADALIDSLAELLRR
jgi:phosphoglycolate phosphatase